MPAIIGAVGRFALKKFGKKALKKGAKSFKIKGQKKAVKVIDGSKGRGKTINKGNKWSRWGEGS